MCLDMMNSVMSRLFVTAAGSLAGICGNIVTTSCPACISPLSGNGLWLWCVSPFAGPLQNLLRGFDHRLWRLQDRIPLGRAECRERRAEILVVGILGRNSHAVPVGELLRKRLALSGDVLDPLSHLAELLIRDDRELGLLSAGDWLWLG